MNKNLLYVLKEAKDQGILTTGGAIIRSPGSIDSYKECVQEGWLYDTQPIDYGIQILETMEKWFYKQKGLKI